MTRDYQIIGTINMIALIFFVFLYQAVSQNINIENINLIITDQDSIMNKIFSTVGIQYFAPYPSTYKTLPSTNTNRMKIIRIDQSIALNNYLEYYDFLTNYPKQTLRKKFVDFVNQYTSQATKLSVVTAYFNSLLTNDKHSIMLSFASYLNKCRIGEYSKYRYNVEVSCKIYNDNYYAYYDVRTDESHEHEHDYILITSRVNNNWDAFIQINETLYT